MYLLNVNGFTSNCSVFLIFFLPNREHLLEKRLYFVGSNYFPPEIDPIFKGFDVQTVSHKRNLAENGVTFINSTNLLSLSEW